MPDEQVRRHLWYPLLNRKPEVLLGIDSPPYLSIAHDSVSKSFVAAASGLSMLAIVETDSADFEVEFDIAQNRWEGFGVFLGAKFSPDEEGEKARTCHLISMRRSARDGRLLWVRQIQPQVNCETVDGDLVSRN